LGHQRPLLVAVVVVVVVVAHVQLLGLLLGPRLSTLPLSQ
jgi:hypothetical protein